MSTLDVLVEVIEEVHDAERSLLAGDLPDRVVFKHVKILWQLLLGIDEILFDSHNYELFELVFENNGEVFTGYTFLGTDFTSVQKNINNAIGSPTESMKIVRILDDETSDDSDETSVSFKLSMLNKIRYTIFRHHMVVNEVFNETDLIDVISSYMRQDIMNTSTELSFSLRTNSTIFDNFYRECLENLLLHDDTVTIQSMATEALELFKRETGVAYFFNSQIAIRYHEQMIDLVKRIFRKHEYVELEIDDYYRHNPIIPLLKPLFRSMALESINTSSANKSDQYNQISDPDNASDLENLLIEKLDIGMVNEILQQVTTAELSNYSGEIPVTLSLFQKIVQYYCDSKIAEGETDIENDAYIVLIKNTVIKWVEGLIETTKFIDQLADLSLIPAALPYTYQHVQFPNAHMRMALFQIKEDIRLTEIYYDRWNVLTRKMNTLKDAYERWNSYNIQKKYLRKWKGKMLQIEELHNKNVSLVELHELGTYYRKWTNRFDYIKINLNMAQTIQSRKYFDIWQHRTQKYKSSANRADGLHQHKLLMKYMTNWVDAKICRFPEKLKEFGLIQKRNYFNIWKTMLHKRVMLQKTGVDIRGKNMLRTFFYKWKKAANEPLIRIKELELKKRTFILKKFFSFWKHQIHLVSLETELNEFRSKALLIDIFVKWHRFKKLTDAENQLRKRLDNDILCEYFGQWRAIYLLNAKANSVYEHNQLSTIFKKWKLETIGKEVGRKHQLREVNRCWKIWKLKAIAAQYNKREDYIVVQKHFIRWQEKTKYMKEELMICEKAIPVVKTALYFDFWRKEYNHNRRMEQLADEFRNRKLVSSETAMKRWMWNVMRISFRENRRKRLELRRIERVSQKRILAVYMNKLKMRMIDLEVLKAKADNYNKLLLLSKYFDLWYTKFDEVSVLHDLLISKLDTENVNLLTKIMSKMQLRMIKVTTDESNADRFKQRWAKMKLKTFFELWKLKLSSRTSPTPTARNIHHGGADDIPDLNPYIDLAPRDRGSPYFKHPLPSRMRSLLSGDVSEYDVEGQINEEEHYMLQTPLNRRRVRSSSILLSASTNSTVFSSALRTPGIKKSSSRLLNYSRLSPEKIEASSLTSAERVRKRNLEERVSRYRLLRSPPKTRDGISGILENVNEEVETEIKRGAGNDVFDTTNESILNTSTPIKS
jgi:hypothetical protein